MSNIESQDPDIRERPADPIADSPEPREPESNFTLAGFWDGSGRLYRTADGNSFVEFNPDDVQNFGPIDPGSVPFLGDDATWVEFGPDAQLQFVRTGPVPPAHEFAVEARYGGSCRAISATLGAWTGYGCSHKRWDPDWPWPTFPFPFTLRRRDL
jgi:hypothetical protein